MTQNEFDDALFNIIMRTPERKAQLIETLKKARAAKGGNK